MIKTAQNDLISVIIPAYNAEKYLIECLSSLFSQDLSIPFEVIVVNDGSTDGTSDILERYSENIKVINQANSGVCKARNAGFKAAKGKFITSLDADDLYLKNKLFRQWQFLKDNPQYAMVFGKIEQFISPELAVGKRHVPEKMRIVPALNFQGGMYRASAFAINGYIDESLYSYGEFIDWFSRAKEKNLKHAILDEVLQKRRVHDLNYGKLRAHEQVDFLKVLRSKLNRAKS
jgi:glycosyltransferase involved in cell wall biosynthesis